MPLQACPLQESPAHLEHLLALVAVGLFSAGVGDARIPGECAVTVILGNMANSAPNRVMADYSTVDDRIAGEQTWGSRAALLTRVARVKMA